MNSWPYSAVSVSVYVCSCVDCRHWLSMVNYKEVGSVLSKEIVVVFHYLCVHRAAVIVVKILRDGNGRICCLYYSDYSFVLVQ